MSLQAVGNTLSLQQIMQLLQQQSLGAADPEAAAAGQAGTPDSAGQNLPADPPAAEESAGLGAQLAPAKPTLDAATIKTLLEIQEAQTKASDDVLLSAGPAPAADLQPAQTDLSTLDPARLQSVLAAMTGSAASGAAIARVTQYIMGLLGGENAGPEESAVGVGPVNAAEE